jgi:hypothetical protein
MRTRVNFKFKKFLFKKNILNNYINYISKLKFIRNLQEKAII